MESSVTSSKSDPEPSAPVINRSSDELPSRSVFLSNRDRLLLRKQALNMKKQLVLAMGIGFSFIFFLSTFYVVLCFILFCIFLKLCKLEGISYYYFFLLPHCPLRKEQYCDWPCESNKRSLQEAPFCHSKCQGQGKRDLSSGGGVKTRGAHAEVPSLFSSLPLNFSFLSWAIVIL